jgi:hypothetical protein
MMAGPGKTPAEMQLEALRQLKQTQARRKPTPAPAPKAPTPAAPPATGVSFELSEQGAAPPKKKGPALALSASQWKRLRERQREHKEFRRRKDMGDWAAELLLALPPGVAALSPAAKEELFRKMRDWAEARGLR